MDIPINYWAVLVAAVAAFALGWLWYGPVFGKTWMRLMGWGEAIPAMKLTPTQAMIGGFIATLVEAYVLAHLMYLFAVVNVTGALIAAFWLWLGLIATVMSGTVLWEGKSVQLYLFNVAYQLVALGIMSVILALWV